MSTVLRNLLSPFLVAISLLGTGPVLGRPGSADLSYETLMFDGLTRSYYLHLPSQARGQARRPVVLVLHGGGKADGDELAKYTSFDEIADREGFLAVFPNGVEAQWNDGRGQTYRKADNTNVDDVGYLSALIDHLISRYNGDPSRVYVTGLSNGGHMALRLGCEISSKLAAIAPVIGSIPKKIFVQCRPDSPLPVLLMNGTDDPLVPWNGGHIRFFRKTMGEVVSAEQTIQFWVKRDGCDPQPQDETLPDNEPGDGSVVKVYRYSNAAGTCDVRLYAVEGGGHNLPGSDIPERRFITGNKNMDIDGAEVIWRFFKGHAR